MARPVKKTVVYFPSNLDKNKPESPMLIFKASTKAIAKHKFTNLIKSYAYKFRIHRYKGRMGILDASIS